MIEQITLTPIPAWAFIWGLAVGLLIGTGIGHRLAKAEYRFGMSMLYYREEVRSSAAEKMVEALNEIKRRLYQHKDESIRIICEESLYEWEQSSHDA